MRLPLMQQLRDERAGLNTAGFISGYRGSPLGGFDLELWRAKKHLEAAKVKFKPGLNEDLGATMVWGTQQPGLFPGANVDGVFGMWYGKGPGVDRCGDVFKHANAAGTSRNGGVLALAADDHNCRSSTLPHGSEHEFVSAMMPVLNPAGVQDILDMGLLGCAMSRFTGRWVGFKTIAETVESSASVDVDPFAMQIVVPGDADFEMPAGRPQHPLAGSAAGPGNAPASLRGEGRAGVRARQRHRPHRGRFAERAARHRHHRQELPRRAAGAGIPGPGRRAPAATSASACTRSA